MNIVVGLPICDCGSQKYYNPPMVQVNGQWTSPKEIKDKNLIVDEVQSYVYIPSADYQCSKCQAQLDYSYVNSQLKAAELQWHALSPQEQEEKWKTYISMRKL